jgi:hypothetical protein
MSTPATMSDVTRLLAVRDLREAHRLASRYREARDLMLQRLAGRTGGIIAVVEL